jgi:RNA polymerase sigma-70 factor (ECF subfamily)
MIQADTEVIWQELSQALRAFIKRRVSNEGDVEDILQDVFYKIHRNINGLKDENRLRGWVYQISRNAIIDYYRRQNILVEISELLPDELLPEPSVGQEIAACLRPLVNHLPDKYKQAIMLTEFNGLTQKEMGERLGLSLSGAKSRVQRGRQELKAMLLACCDFEFDQMGHILAYQPRQNDCGTACDEICGKPL